MPTPVERATTLRNLVREQADESDAQRHLSAVVAKAFSRERLYRIAAPCDYFGSEDDPRTRLKRLPIQMAVLPGIL